MYTVCRKKFARVGFVKFRIQGRFSAWPARSVGGVSGGAQIKGISTGLSPPPFWIVERREGISEDITRYYRYRRMPLKKKLFRKYRLLRWKMWPLPWQKETFRIFHDARLHGPLSPRQTNTRWFSRRPRWPRFPFLFLFFLLRFFIGLKGLRRGKGEGGGHFAMTAGHIFRKGKEQRRERAKNRKSNNI